MESVRFLVLHDEKDGEDSEVSLSFNGSTSSRREQRKTIVDIPKIELEKNAMEEINKIASVFFNNKPTNGFFVDEIEFGLVIGVDGKVSIVTLVEGSATAQFSIKVKLKRE